MLVTMTSWYSDYPAARTRQITTDILAVAVIILAVLAGVAVGSAVGSLGEVGRQVELAGQGFETTLGDAGASLGTVPLVGEGIRAPFDEASAAGAALADAGRSLQDAVGVVAILSAVVTAAGPVIFVVLVWLLPRLLFLRRSRETRALYRSPNGPALLALRALSRRPLAELSTVSATPLDAWRANDPGVVVGLAALELRRAGVKP